eukprot:TRINITY_DN1200_c0_g1_i1.p1 TRINITY_DN1200_c0_g1~~TRINITY_DN1200_c0_g1_i1.p1  ORF type:complete len:380 (+),score=48.83 TRINITY_DN1200_c0_g1_i1:193-1332(+)
MLLRSTSTPLLSSLLPVHAEWQHTLYHDSDYDHPKWQMTFPAAHSSYASPLSQHVNSALPDDTRSLENGATAWDLEESVTSLRKALSETDLQALGRSVSSPAALIAAESFLGDGSPCNLRKRPWVRRHRAGCNRLKTIPSFRREGEAEEEEEEKEEAAKVPGRLESLDQNEEFGTKKGLGSGLPDSSGSSMKRMAVKSEGKLGLYMACGLGIENPDTTDVPSVDSGAGGSGGNWSRKTGTGGGGGHARNFNDMEQYYDAMLQQDPGNPLLLRNYAQFLHETKHDYRKAEDMYSRAILADPTDGDTLAKYAKLVWELHRDEEKASGYFEQATRASSDDCNVFAAYASFLWETDDKNEEEETLSRNDATANVYESMASVSA